MSDHTGRFIWYELLTNDPDAAHTFYSELVGWGHMVWEEGEMPYRMFTRGDMPCAGLLQLPEDAQMAGSPSMWLGYVYVPDREAAVARATELGATKMVELEVPDVGRFAVLRDPQGAMLAAYTPDNDPGPEGDAEAGQFSWHELATSDLEAAWSFYSEMFGWELMEDMDMGEAGTYRIFGRNGRQLGGIFNRTPEMPVSTWLYYIRTASCEDAAGTMEELGGDVANGPMEVPGGDHVLQAMDPTGAMFAMHSAGTADED